MKAGHAFPSSFTENSGNPRATAPRDSSHHEANRDLSDGEPHFWRSSFESGWVSKTRTPSGTWYQRCFLPTQMWVRGSITSVFSKDLVLDVAAVARAFQGVCGCLSHVPTSCARKRPPLEDNSLG